MAIREKRGIPKSIKAPLAKPFHKMARRRDLIGACSDCPFKMSSPLDGSPDWLKDVMTFHYANKYFHHTCHKTDPNADGYVGGKKRECRGHLQMILNETDKTPGKGGVYPSISCLIERYLKHWLGEAEFERLRLEARK